MLRCPKYHNQLLVDHTLLRKDDTDRWSDCKSKHIDIRECVGLYEVSDFEKNLLSRLVSDGIDFPSVTSICVIPPHVSFVKEELRRQLEKENIDRPNDQSCHNDGGSDHSPTISAVINFPGGDEMSLNRLLQEVEVACVAGASEIDVVIPFRVINENEEFGLDILTKMFKSIREVYTKGQLIVKVILETAELKTEDKIRKACRRALQCDCDFLKTSTDDATSPTSINCGIKLSGGIRTVSTASKLMEVVAEKMGKEWINKNTFRIGSSSLLSKLRSKE